MGSWKLENAVELQWNEGHLWKLEFPLPRERSNFEFKVGSLLHVSECSQSCL